MTTTDPRTMIRQAKGGDDILEQPITFDEVDAKLLLMGSITEQFEGLRALNREYQRIIYALIKRRFPGFGRDDISNCYADAIADLSSRLAIYSRNPHLSDFDPDRPLLPYFKTIALRRAMDRFRRATVQTKAIRGCEEHLRAGGGFPGRMGPGLMERREFREAVAECISRLPPSPRAVYGAMLGHLLDTGDLPSDAELMDALQGQTGRPWTLAAIKGGKRNGREALQMHLNSKGYDCDW